MLIEIYSIVVCEWNVFDLRNINQASGIQITGVWCYALCGSGWISMLIINWKILIGNVLGDLAFNFIDNRWLTTMSYALYVMNMEFKGKLLLLLCKMYYNFMILTFLWLLWMERGYDSNSYFMYSSFYMWLDFETESSALLPIVICYN